MTRTEPLYYELIERNDWEQETWSFFFPVKGNEAFAAELAARIKNGPERKSAFSGRRIFPYELVLEPKALGEVDRLTSLGVTTYMKRWNKVDRVFRIDRLKEGDDLFSQLYKGGLRTMGRKSNTRS